jgi:predicted Rossmann fold flavoprotein
MNLRQKVPTIAIIGAGAAGLMSAATILEQSTKPCSVLLFDKNKGLGTKVLISGGGRCNVTTGIKNKQVLLTKYTRGSDFLIPALHALPPQKVLRFFEDHGVPLKTEADNRVFPASDNGHDIVGVFEKIFTDPRLTLHLTEGVISITKEKTFTITTHKGTYEADSVILATGGNAYRQTGSSGDGYAFAKALGHSITPLGPSLNSFLTQETWPHELKGIALENTRLTFGKIKVEGPLLFTHFGISGPATFALSSHCTFEKLPITITLRIDASKDFQTWDTLLKDMFERHPKKKLLSLLSEHFPKRLTQTLITLSKVSTNTNVSELSKKERHALAHTLSDSLALTLTQRRPGDEFVTAGGIPTDEVDETSMESKITPHLFIVGELLDVDGVTGGFNLQSSWATGYVAATKILHDLP